MSEQVKACVCRARGGIREVRVEQAADSLVPQGVQKACLGLDGMELGLTWAQGRGCCSAQETSRE